MTLRLSRRASRELTRLGLVLSIRRTGRRSIAATVLLAGMLSMAAASGYFYRDLAPSASAASGAEVQSRLLEQRLEQGRLTLGMAEARSHELERQIDALNQRLRESQDELTFFRQARDGKH